MCTIKLQNSTTSSKIKARTPPKVCDILPLCAMLQRAPTTITTTTTHHHYPSPAA